MKINLITAKFCLAFATPIILMLTISLFFQSLAQAHSHEHKASFAPLKVSVLVEEFKDSKVKSLPQYLDLISRSTTLPSRYAQIAKEISNGLSYQDLSGEEKSTYSEILGTFARLKYKGETVKAVKDWVSLRTVQPANGLEQYTTQASKDMGEKNQRTGKKPWL